MKIAILGYGTVASGVVNVCNVNKDILNGIKVEVAYVRNLSKYSHKVENGVHYSKDGVKLVTSLDEVINEKPDVVLELMGGIDFAKEAIKKFLSAKIPVITANKALLADNKEEIFSLARDNNVFLGYEPSTAGAIPIIKVIKEGLSANKILSIKAILNGTSNYIMSLMSEGSDYAVALKEAQDLGYAEADPFLDVSGYDAAHKIIILSCLAFGAYFVTKDIVVRGIESVSSKDIAYAKKQNKTIKLIANSSLDDKGELEVWVSPCMIDNKSPLNIGGAKNSILVNSNAAKESLYSGEGAGGDETASAVISDIIDFRKNPSFYMPPKKDIKLKPYQNIEKKFYIRLLVDDKIGIMSKIAKSLSDHQISIANMLQELENEKANIYITTHQTSQKNINEFLDSLDNDIEKSFMYIA